MKGERRDGNAGFDERAIDWPRLTGRALAGKGAAMSEKNEQGDAPKAEFPDRLCMDPRSPHFDGAILEKGVGIRFNGVEKVNVEEYCLSEGWIRIAAGKSRDRHGNPMTVKLKGKVEPFWYDDEEK